MTTVSHGKPYAGNPHVRFEEGASESAKPSRKAILHNELTKSEKRKCRELIQLGLNRECAKFIEHIEHISRSASIRYA